MKKLLPADFEIDRYGLHCRLVREDDAEFIVSIRSDEKLGRFIHASDGMAQKQVEWIREYKTREEKGEDYYFIFESLDGKFKYGVNRAYHIDEVSFTTGSWVFDRNAPIGSSVLSEIMLKEIMFNLYPNHIQKFTISKRNTNVLRYAMSFHPTLIDEDADNLYFENSRENAEKYKRIYLRLIK